MLERDGYPAGVPCFVDTAQPDPVAATEFYGGLFGWQFEDRMLGGLPGHFFGAKLDGREVAAIASQDSSPQTPSWMTYIAVDDADATAAAVSAAGGSVLTEPVDVFAAGRMAVCADPQGATFGIWRAGRHKGAQVVNVPGSWNWSDLKTRDVDGAKAFYGAVFGWRTSEFGGATMFHLPGYVGGEPEQPVARDVVAAMVAGEQAAWSVDFWIDDVDAAAERATALGGTVLSPPADAIVGRSALIADPGGAVFSLSQIRP
jgi:uncharacterized protein